MAWWAWSLIYLVIGYFSSLYIFYIRPHWYNDSKDDDKLWSNISYCICLYPFIFFALIVELIIFKIPRRVLKKAEEKEKDKVMKSKEEEMIERLVSASKLELDSYIQRNNPQHQNLEV